MSSLNYFDDAIKAVGEIFDDNPNILDIISFAESPRFLNLKLFPVQKFILKLFYNLELDDYDKNIEFTDVQTKVEFFFTEAEYLEYLSTQKYDGHVRTNLDFLNEYDGQPNELQLVCGRKGGKTFLTSVIAAYETYKLIEKENPQKYYGLAEGDEIRINNIANSKTQAQLLFAAIKARILNCPYFQKYILFDPSADTIRISIPRDLIVTKEQKIKTSTILISSLTCTARGIRGGNCITVMFDELAHFMDDERNSSGKEIYDTLTPSIASFGKDGKVISLSTPLNKSGIFYQIYKGSVNIVDMVMVQIPTWEMNPSVSKEFLRSEFNKKPESFDCEYGAQFRNTLTKFLKYPEFLDSCINTGTLEAERGNPRLRYYLALDPSQGQNGYAAVLGHKATITDQSNNPVDKVVIDKINKWQIGRGVFTNAQIIDPAIIEEWIIGLRKLFNIVLVVFDQFDSNYIVNNLIKRGINAERHHFTDKYNHLIYTNLRDLIYNRKFEMYDESEAIEELRQLNENISNRGYSRVSAPSGLNDDMADAIAHVSYHIVNREIAEGTKIVSGVQTSNVSSRVSMSSRRSSLMLKKIIVPSKSRTNRMRRPM